MSYYKTPEELLLEKEFFRSMEKCLLSIDKRIARAFAARVMNGMTLREVGKLIGHNTNKALPLSTVRTRQLVNLALCELAKQLHEFSDCCFEVSVKHINEPLNRPAYKCSRYVYLKSPSTERQSAEAWERWQVSVELLNTKYKHVLYSTKEELLPMGRQFLTDVLLEIGFINHRCDCVLLTTNTIADLLSSVCADITATSMELKMTEDEQLVHL